MLPGSDDLGGAAGGLKLNFGCDLRVFFGFDLSSITAGACC